MIRATKNRSDNNEHCPTRPRVGCARCRFVWLRGLSREHKAGVHSDLAIRLSQVRPTRRFQDYADDGLPKGGG